MRKRSESEANKWANEFEVLGIQRDQRSADPAAGKGD